MLADFCPSVKYFCMQKTKKKQAAKPPASEILFRFRYSFLCFLIPVVLIAEVVIADLAPEIVVLLVLGVENHFHRQDIRTVQCSLNGLKLGLGGGRRDGGLIRFLCLFGQRRFLCVIQ